MSNWWEDEDTPAHVHEGHPPGRCLLEPGTGGRWRFMPDDPEVSVAPFNAECILDHPIIHAAPVGDAGLTPCCGLPPFELRADRTTSDGRWVTCPRRRRLAACVEKWPECTEGEYNPACCRFPKSCSATVYDPATTPEDALEPAFPKALRLGPLGIERPAHEVRLTGVGIEPEIDDEPKTVLTVEDVVKATGADETAVRAVFAMFAKRPRAEGEPLYMTQPEGPRFHSLNRYQRDWELTVERGIPWMRTRHPGGTWTTWWRLDDGPA